MPSEILQIDNDAMAFDFDLLCTLRLLYYDNAKAEAEVEAMGGGGQSGGQPSGQPPLPNQRYAQGKPPEVW